MYRARIDSPFGPILLCGSGEGVAGLYFVDQQDCPPLAEAPPARADSFRPSSGMIGGVALSTLRPARRAGQGATKGRSDGQMALFSGGDALRGAQSLSAPHFSTVRESDENAGELSYDAESLVLLQGDTPADVVDLFGLVQAELAQYFAGVRKEFDFPLTLAGTPFQMKVWQALCDVPYGEVVSYGQLAVMAGLTPGHGRPVGMAVGRNPVSIVVPCHRIIGSNRTLTGYTGGLSRKVALLELEGFEFSG